MLAFDFLFLNQLNSSIIIMVEKKNLNRSMNIYLISSERCRRNHCNKFQFRLIGDNEDHTFYHFNVNCLFDSINLGARLDLFRRRHFDKMFSLTKSHVNFLGMYSHQHWKHNFNSPNRIVIFEFSVIFPANKRNYFRVHLIWKAQFAFPFAHNLDRSPCDSTRNV